jgi:hypothetical protein
LYPNVDAPDINPFGGRITNTTDVLMTAAQGDIYYTIDGGDPLSSSGGPSLSAVRLNSVDIVSGDSSARTLIPTGAASENGWQTFNYNDSAWNDSFAAIGYDSGLADDVVQVPNGFRVRSVKSAGQLDTLDSADRALAGENISNTRTVDNVPYLNYFEGTRDAHFDNNLVFPITGDHFALEATGKLLVRKAGMYTLGINRNDAVRLELDGRVLFADAERFATRDQFVPIQLTEGEHDVRVTYFDRTTTAVLEFFYAPGEKTEFDDSFRLVGDSQHRAFGSTIRTDLRERMAGKNASAYSRIAFELPDPNRYDNLFLRMFHDDGFVAYLNGTEIARDNAPETVTFNSVATQPRSDVAALTTAVFDVSAHKALLRPGTNILAFQALNLEANDPDLLFVPRLVGTIAQVPIRVTESTHLRARVELNGEWSAITETQFRLNEPATVDDLRVSEVHYHPRPATEDEIAAGFQSEQDFEFVEIINISNKTVDLADVRFSKTTVGDQELGIDFAFRESPVFELKPGERAVVVEDLAAFAKRYGDTITVAGQWSGALGNSSDTISLLVGDTVVQRFAYDDRWYPNTDGLGASLEIKDPRATALADWENPRSWQASAIDGTPGRGPGDRPGDANRDGIFDVSDLILVFQAGEYEDNIPGNSTWEEGDWNGDGDFTSSDILLAFVEGRYVGAEPAGARAALVDHHELDDSQFSRRRLKNPPEQDPAAGPAELASVDIVFAGVASWKLTRR